MSDHDEYPEIFIKGLQWMWGEGYLSPGGSEEVSRIVHGLDLSGCRVLDVGCGLGAADSHLVRHHHAGTVVGVDVAEPLLQQARTLADKTEIGDQLEFVLVEPGELPFDDGEFDVVFSKDSMVHIPDKRSCYRDLGRLLKPEGWLAFGDWFGSSDAATDEMTQWLDVVGLNFALGTIEDAALILQELGFAVEHVEDRNAWYAEYMTIEMASLEGENFSRLAREIGQEAAQTRFASSSLKQLVVEQGQLRPGHIRAQKPK